MKPTFYLRYIPVYHDKSTPLCCSYNYGDAEYSQLQQWWEDENGEGEWRFVDIDFSYTNNKPNK